MFNCLISSNGLCSVCKDGFRQKDGICIKETAPTI
jgi:recombinational DNA repair protein RecR